MTTPPLPEGIMYRFMLEYVDSHNSECAQRPAPYIAWVNSADVGPNDNIKRFKASFPTVSTRFQKDNSLKDYGLSIRLIATVFTGVKMMAVPLASSDFITSSMVKKAFTVATAGGSLTSCRLSVPAYTAGSDELLDMWVTFVEVATERYLQSVEIGMPLEVYALVATRQKLGSFTSLADVGAAMCKDAGVGAGI